MSLEVFVRATGSAMGLARDSFGFNAGAGAGLTSTPGPSATLAAAVSGSGQAASASNNESIAVNANVSALGAQNLATNAHLDSTLAAAGAGRSQMDSVIAAALADITSLAPATTTPVGQLDLLNRCVCHLKHTSQILTNGQSDASTRAASAGQLVAAYNGLGNGSVGGLAQTSPMALTSAVSPMGAASSLSAASPLSPMSSMQNMSMLTAAQMAASQAALAGSQAATMQQSTPQPAPSNGAQVTSATQTIPPKVQDVLNRAANYIGTPYSYGGGTPSGPTRGPGTAKPGFDCSSFVQMAYWPYVHLPRTAHEQMSVGTTVSPSDIQPGDLIFSEFGEGGKPKTEAGHVQMAIGWGANSPVISAAHTGTTIGDGPMESGTIVVKRILH
jgi:peptidoglycan DL-endopeptidase CwlO